MHGRFDGRYGVQLRFEREKEFEEFLDRYTFSELRFITGCGFESRATVMMAWLANHAGFKVECLGVDLLNKRDPSYPKARPLQRRTMGVMQDIAQKKRWRFTLVKSDLYSTRSVAHRFVLNALKSMLRIFPGDYLVDISSLPRSIALPVLKILWNSVRVRNLLVAYTEDTRVGALERQAINFRRPSYLPLFSPGPSPEKFSVWFPILGWNKYPIEEIRKSFSFNETYPIVGFPSTRPIETDRIVRLNKPVISDQAEKVIFASMNDPFQLSIKMNNAIEEIRSALKRDVSIVISPHGSKPQSVGVFITAMTQGASIVYCQPRSYRPREGGIGSSHLYWLKGSPYGT